MTTWSPCEHCGDPKFCEWMPSAQWCAFLAEEAAAQESRMAALDEERRARCLWLVRHSRGCVREPGHDGSHVTCLGELSDLTIVLTPEGLALSRWGMHAHERDPADRVFAPTQDTKMPPAQPE